MALGHVTDLFTRAKARLMLQYRTLLTRFIPDLGVLIAESQELEDAFWQMFLYLDVYMTTGVWLERLGHIIGEESDGVWAGTPFRQIVLARIAANKSKGTSNDVLLVSQLMINLFHPGVLVDWYPAAQTLTIEDPEFVGPDQTSIDFFNRALRIFARARAVAVQLTVRYQDDTDTEIFVTGDATGAITPVGKGFDDAAAPDDPAAGRLSGAAIDHT